MLLKVFCSALLAAVLVCNCCELKAFADTADDSALEKTPVFEPELSNAALIAPLPMSVKIDPVASNSHSASLPELSVGIGLDVPPWVIAEQNAGIEIDILNAAMQSQGYRVKPLYVANGLAMDLFNQDRIDAVINVTDKVVREGVFLSEPVVAMEKVAISLVEKNFPANVDIEFLRDKSVVAFQRASSLLGDEFAAMASANDQYRESHRQRLQVNLLMIRDVDFIVLDKSVFGYYWHAACDDASLKNAKGLLHRPVRFHHLFEPSEYSFAFHNAGVRDAFNRGLARLKRDGSYDRIIENYAHLTALHPQHGHSEVLHRIENPY